MVWGEWLPALVSYCRSHRWYQNNTMCYGCLLTEPNLCCSLILASVLVLRLSGPKENGGPRKNFRSLSWSGSFICQGCCTQYELFHTGNEWGKRTRRFDWHGTDGLACYIMSLFVTVFIMILFSFSFDNGQNTPSLVAWPFFLFASL